MKKYVFLTLAICAVITAVITGCDLLKEHSAEIHQTVATSLQNAYNNGGAEKINAKIDALVAEGKLSTLQAEKLKEALQKGYDSLQTKLNELAVKDVEVEPEQTAK